MLLKILNLMDIKEDLLLWFIKFFAKMSAGSGANDKVKQNQLPLDLATHQLAEELHKRIIRIF